VDLHTQIDREKIVVFCKKWKIVELSLFGSVLRNDFRADSDIDFLVTFAPDTDWSLFDEVAMNRELASIVGRPVDLVDRSVIEQSTNPWRKNAILSTAKIFHVEK
jgi:hypothetical protein